ncbi:outer membrane protein assembly factor BamE [Desertibaculum subflavum]|uniref:outer membrane protein assembly factor BamE n=1 Tax=Desertibaculum subflavum TaxID=2268458 RepID=UPI000E672E3B
MFRGQGRLIWLGAAILLLAACAAREEFRGHKTDADQLAQVKPGAQGPDEVRVLLGSPSSISTFGEAGITWYYIARETSQVAWLAEETVDQRVVAIDFKEGKVAEVRQIGLKDGKPVEPVERITPTKGKELTVVEQFLGNLGKFNK